MSFSCNDHGVGHSADLHTMPGSTHTAAAGHLKWEGAACGAAIRMEVRPIQIVAL